MIITVFPNTTGKLYEGKENPLRVRRPLANCYESRNLS